MVQYIDFIYCEHRKKLRSKIAKNDIVIKKMKEKLNNCKYNMI